MQSSTHRLASSGAGRGRLLLYAALLLLVFGGLLAVAAFYDLRLDAFLTRSALAPGQYYTNQVFGTFFEIVGDSPVELFLAFAIDVIFVWSLRFTRGKKRAAGSTAKRNCSEKLIAAFSLQYICRFRLFAASDRAANLLFVFRRENRQSTGGSPVKNRSRRSG